MVGNRAGWAPATNRVDTMKADVAVRTNVFIERPRSKPSVLAGQAENEYCLGRCVLGNGNLLSLWGQAHSWSTSYDRKGQVVFAIHEALNDELAARVNSGGLN